MATININGSFEEGWDELFTGTPLVNQKPKRWQASWVPLGQYLWDSTDEAEGIPEMVHKLAVQLPPEEQLGGSDALILDGTHVYKIFHFGAPFGAELRQTITGLEPGSEAFISVPIRAHVHSEEVRKDAYAVEFRMQTNGEGGWWNQESLPHRKWVRREQSRTIGDDGRLTIVLQVKSKWPTSVDWFFDAIELTAVPGEPTEPPPDAEGLEERVVSLEAAVTDLVTLGIDLDRRVTALEGGTIPPPDPERIDLTPYFTTGEQFGTLYEVKTMQGLDDLGQQRHQTQTESPVFYFCKNDQWEMLRIGPDHIERKYDTSLSEDKYYAANVDSSGTALWSPWCRRQMAVGESSFSLGNIVVRYKSGNCAAILPGSGSLPSYIKLVAVHDTWQSPHGGISLRDVIQLRWSLTLDGLMEEDFYFAKGFGLVGWDARDGRIARISEIHAPGQRPNAEREVVPCLSL